MSFKNLGPTNAKSYYIPEFQRVKRPRLGGGTESIRSPKARLLRGDQPVSKMYCATLREQLQWAQN